MNWLLKSKLESNVLICDEGYFQNVQRDSFFVIFNIIEVHTFTVDHHSLHAVFALSLMDKSKSFGIHQAV